MTAGRCNASECLPMRKPLRSGRTLPQSVALLLWFSLWVRHGGHSPGFSRRLLFATLWLAETARVIGSPEPSATCRCTNFRTSDFVTNVRIPFSLQLPLFNLARYKLTRTPQILPSPAMASMLPSRCRGRCLWMALSLTLAPARR